MEKSLFITVNYCNAALTIQLLKNLYALSGIENFEIAVVDNTPSNTDFDKINEYKNSISHPNLTLFRSEKNLGYFGAANFVIKNDIFKNYSFKYIIISNNDIEIPDSNFLITLLGIPEDAAVIAPDIISILSHNHQNPYRERPIKQSQKIQYQLLYSNYYVGYLLHFIRKIFKKILLKNKREDTNYSRKIFSAHGSFFIFTKKYFDAGCIIDDTNFLYGEEDTVSAQCNKHAIPIIYYPELKVYHNEHRTTKGEGFKKSIYYQQKKSYQNIKHKYLDYF